MNTTATEYIRIGTEYYAIRKKNVNGKEIIVERKLWRKSEIITDFGKDIIKELPKFFGYKCEPNHIHYTHFIGDYFNSYSPILYNIDTTSELSLNSLKEQIPITYYFLQHIFGNQYLLAIDYFKILLFYPEQILPIIVLVSRNRETGKTTFLNWIKEIFDKNAVFVKANAFTEKFNSEMDSKLLLLIEEVKSENKDIVEAIKYISTAMYQSIEYKGQEKVEQKSFLKIIMTSNHEHNFLKIDKEETRFWVIKVPLIRKRSTEFFTKLIQEIPIFLNYLYRVPFTTEKKTRMWFTPETLHTEALHKLKHDVDLQNKNLVLDILDVIFNEFDMDQIDTTPSDINALLNYYNRGHNITMREIQTILENIALVRSTNSNNYERVKIEDNTLKRTIHKGKYYRISKETLLNQMTDEINK
ncbi:primase-helicase family protein [Myroides sp.]|uniref:primase-helicase family protein n=1 Tax=Myroides sp. TaxID=1874736 RepID=UPI003F2FEC7B